MTMLIAIVVPIGGSFLLQQKDIKSSLASWVQERSGRELQIKGRLGFEPGLKLRLFAEDVEYQNAAWASRPAAFEAEQVALDLSLLDLLKGKISISHLTLRNASLWIEQRGGNGEFNLVERKTAPMQESAKFNIPEWFNLSTAVIEDSEIIVVHPRRTWQIDLDQAALSSDSRVAPIVGYAQGALQGVSITLGGILGSQESWISRSASEADVEVTIAGSKVKAQGNINDVLRWKGLDLELSGRVEKLKHLSPLFFSPPLDIRQIVGQTRLVQPGTVSTMRLEQIQSTAKLWGIPIRTKGTVEKLMQLQGINLMITADGPVDAEEWSLPNLAISSQIEGSLKGSSRFLVAEVKSALFRTDSAELTASGVIPNISGDWKSPLPVNFEITNLSKFGENFNKQWPITETISGTTNILREQGDFRLEEIMVINAGDGNTLKIKDPVVFNGSAPEGDLNFVAQLGHQFFKDNPYDLSRLPDKLGMQGAFKMTRELTEIAFTKIDVSGPGVSAIARGNIPDIRKLSNFQFDLDVSISDLTTLFPESEFHWPLLGNISIQGALRGTGDGEWRVSEILGAAEKEGDEIGFSGELARVSGKFEPDIRFHGNVAPLTALVSFPALKALDSVVGELSSIEFDGVVANTVSTNFAINDLRISTQWLGMDLRLDGDVTQLSPAKGPLSIAINGYPQAMPQFLTSFNLPEIKHVNIRSDIGIETKSLSNVNAVVNFGNGEFRIEGDVPQLTPIKTEQLTLSMVADDLASYLPSDNKIQDQQPLNVDMALGLDTSGFTLNGTAQFGDTDVEGTVIWSPPGEGDEWPKWQISSHSKLLNLESLIKKPTAGLRFFSSSPLAPRWVEKQNLEWHATADQFIDHAIKLENIKFEIFKNNKQFNQNLTAEVKNGQLDVNVSTKFGSESNVNVEFENLPVGSVSALSKKELFQGGLIAGSIELSGQGSSLADLVDRGSGTIALDIKNAKIQGNALETVGGDLLSNILTVINPFREWEDYVEVHCGAIRIDIKDGRAATRNGLAMKTDRVTLLGTGEISFPSEVIKIVIAPKPRKGLGISPSSIAKMIRIGGTLSKPKTEADAKGFFKSGAAIGAAIASGGLTLVAQGLLDRLQAGQEACESARGEQAEETSGKQLESATQSDR